MSKSSMKTLTIILSALMLSGTLFGCSQKSKVDTETDEKTTISVALMCSDWLDTAQEVMDNFSKKYPNIKVEFTPMPGEVEEYLQTKAASNSLPDFISINAGSFGSQLAKNGMIADLKDTECAKNTVDGLKQVFTSKDDKLFGIPGGLSTTLIYYNKKLFAEAGITELPKNWDEFLIVCEKLKSKSITPLIFASADGNVSNTVWSNGFATNIISKDPNYLSKINDGTFDFNTKEFADVFGKAKTLYDKGYLIKGVVSLMYGQANDAFLQGKAAMAFNGIWLSGTFMTPDSDIGVFMPPWNEAGKDQTPILGTETGYAVSNGKNKDAALKLLDYMTQGEGYYTIQKKKGNIPSLKVYDESKVKLDPEIEKYVKNLKTYKITGPYWFEFLPAVVYSKLPQIYQQVLTDEITPEQAAKTIDETFKSITKK